MQTSLFEQPKLPDFISNVLPAPAKRSEANWKLIHDTIAKNIQESIALNQMVLNGSTTIRDLTQYMNAPHGVIRDIIKRGIAVYTEDEWVTCANGKKTKVHRYYLEPLVK